MASPNYPCRFDRRFRSWWLPPLHLGGYTSKSLILLVLVQGWLSSFFVLPSSVQEHFFLFVCPLVIFFGLIPNCLGTVPLVMWRRFMGYFPWPYPRPQLRFGKVASFSGSYGFVPMKWVPQLNDIRISLPEFRGRSPTLILMLYVNELYVYCPSQSSVQDLYAGIIQLYPKINLEREIGFPVFFFGCRMPKSYSVSTWIWFIHHSLASQSRRLEILGILWSVMDNW